jgi:ATP-dependent protease ClpP protease subunit
MHSINKSVETSNQNNFSIAFESSFEQNYYFDTKFCAAKLDKFLEFYNKLLLIQTELNKPTTLNFYLTSPGGDLYIYSVLKTIFENSPLNINIICTGYIASAAFLLFYKTDNVNKYLDDGSIALVHTITTVYDDRDIRKNKEVITIKSNLDKQNESLAKMYKAYEVLTDKQLKELLEGEDILLDFESLIQVMNKCPYGTFTEPLVESYEIDEDLDSTAEEELIIAEQAKLLEQGIARNKKSKKK